MIGQRIAQYEIQEELGRGGMGVVYLARDTSLNRQVALKFLPPYLTQDAESRERFVREARAAASIEHPNICTIHEIGETDDGRTYIVMAYYRGDTLNDVIAQGPLPPDRVARIAWQIADALAAAHAQGIVHRDIKPGNIVVGVRDEVKLLDFGLAKLTGQVDLTREGSTTGTAAYMSPEQVRGESADSRTDVWSLGVVMYEMLSGERPFRGAYEQAVSYAILNVDPDWPDGPDWLLETIQAAMTKSADERTAAAKQVAEALRERQDAAATRTVDTAADPPQSRKRRRLLMAFGTVALVIAAGAAIWGFWSANSEEAASAGDQSITSMAVLPFSNLRSDPDTDYLGYALADQVIAALAYFQNLSVRPSSSIRQYEGRNVDAVMAGGELKVDYVLSGTYLREADMVRMSLELVDLRDNKLVWREPIEVAYENTFQLQDLVSQKVVDGLRVQFSTDEIERIQSDVPRSPVAYELFLRSLPLGSDVANTRVAAGLLREAVRQDSMFAPAWGALGLRVRHLEVFDNSYDSQFGSALSYFEKALALNDQLLSTLTDLAVLHSDLGQLDQAYQHASRILEINPNSAFGHFALGYIFRYAGLLDLSVDEMRTAIRLDSTDRRLRSAQITFLNAGLYDEAVHAAYLDGDSPYARSAAGMARLAEGRIDEGLALLRQNLDSESYWSLWAESLISGYEEGHGAGNAALTTLTGYNLADSEIWYWYAIGYMLNENYESAIETLAISIQRGYSNWPDLENNPQWDAVRGDARFQDLVKRARAESDAFRRRNGIG